MFDNLTYWQRIADFLGMRVCSHTDRHSAQLMLNTGEHAVYVPSVLAAAINRKINEAEERELVIKKIQSRVGMKTVQSAIEEARHA